MSCRVNGHIQNFMAANLTLQVREIAEVTTAVAEGDLGKKIQRPAEGEIFQLQQTINRMVGQLRTFATEVTKVARDVGKEGVLGGQAEVEGVRGEWNELTINGQCCAPRCLCKSVLCLEHCPFGNRQWVESLHLNPLSCVVKLKISLVHGTGKLTTELSSQRHGE